MRFRVRPASALRTLSEHPDRVYICCNCRAFVQYERAGNTFHTFRSLCKALEYQHFMHRKAEALSVCGVTWRREEFSGHCRLVEPSAQRLVERTVLSHTPITVIGFAVRLMLIFTPCTPATPRRRVCVWVPFEPAALRRNLIDHRLKVDGFVP